MNMLDPFCVITLQYNRCFWPIVHRKVYFFDPPRKTLTQHYLHFHIMWKHFPTLCIDLVRMILKQVMF